MKTNFTSEDVKNIVSNLYKSLDEEIIIKNLGDNSTEQKSLVDYLNIEFYTWKNRVSSENDWLNSLELNANKIYGLVEVVENEANISNDIDSATLGGRITFLVPTNKVGNLDYYCSKIRNHYIGEPQDIQNAYGDTIKAYFNMGILLYESEPEMTQIGECLTASVNFTFSYLTNAQVYQDTQLFISLDNGTTYLQMPYIKMTWQNVATSTAVPTQSRPDLTGFVASSISCVKTISYYDFDKTLSNALNELFWSMGAISIDSVATTTQNVNKVVYVKIINNGKTYIYKDMIDNMQKVISNGDFNVCSITLKGYGKTL